MKKKKRKEILKILTRCQIICWLKFQTKWKSILMSTKLSKKSINLPRLYDKTFYSPPYKLASHLSCVRFLVPYFYTHYYSLRNSISIINYFPLPTPQLNSRWIFFASTSYLQETWHNYTSFRESKKNIQFTWPIILILLKSVLFLENQYFPLSRYNYNIKRIYIDIFSKRFLMCPRFCHY